jgi:hypothetical protein
MRDTPCFAMIFEAGERGYRLLTRNTTLAVCVRWFTTSFCFVTIALTISCVGSANSPIITPSEALLSPNQKVQFTAQVAEGARLWLVNGVPGGASSFGTMSATGMYTAKVPSSGSFNTAIRVSVIVNGAESLSVPVSLFLPGKLTPGIVSSTANALASYSIPAPVGTSVQIQFGSDINYGPTTWSQPAPASGGKVSILVAGMRASSIYRMRAVTRLADGTQSRFHHGTFARGSTSRRYHTAIRKPATSVLNCLLCRPVREISSRP